MRTLSVFTILALIGMTSLALGGEAIAAPAQEVKVATLVGTGTAKIKRKIGTELIAAQGDKLLPGDSLRTDANITVDLGLADGSLVRVGPGSDYKIENISADNKGVWSWDFTLSAGSMRAIVEKTKRKGFVKFKTRTPTGTIGVRGTSFVLKYLPEETYTKLYTTEGSVYLAAPGVDFKNKKLVRIVEHGKMSQIRKGEKMPSEPREFSQMELLSSKMKAGTVDVAIGTPAEEEQKKLRKEKLKLADVNPLFYDLKGPKAVPSGEIPADDAEMLAAVKKAEALLENARAATAKSGEALANEIKAAEAAADGSAGLSASEKESLLGKGGKDSLEKSSEKNCPEGFNNYKGSCVAPPVMASGSKKATCPEGSEMNSVGQCEHSMELVKSNITEQRRTNTESFSQSKSTKKLTSSAGCYTVVKGGVAVCTSSGGGSCPESACGDLNVVRNSIVSGRAQTLPKFTDPVFSGENSPGGANVYIPPAQQPETYSREQERTNPGRRYCGIFGEYCRGDNHQTPQTDMGNRFENDTSQPNYQDTFSGSDGGGGSGGDGGAF